MTNPSYRLRLPRRAMLGGAVMAAAARPGAAVEKTVRIGVQKYGTLIILRLRRTLERALAPLGWQVTWHEFPGGPQLLEALGAGAIDFGTRGRHRRSSRRRPGRRCCM